MTLQIRKHPNPILTQVCEEVTIDEEKHKLQKLMHDMVATMHDHQGIGLSAPQVGVSKRILVAKVLKEFRNGALKDKADLRMINPVIKESFGWSTQKEGCLSYPGLYIRVGRPNEITVRYLDVNLGEQELVLSSWMARIVQHEIDHLDGKTIFQKASSRQRKEINEYGMVMR